MSLYMVIPQVDFNMFDFDEPISFKLYSDKKGTVFDASSYPAANSVMKTLKRPGDANLFYKDIAKGIKFVRGVAQIVADINVVWTSQATGEGTFTFTSTKRIGIGGHVWFQAVLKKGPLITDGRISTKLVRKFTNPSHELTT